MHRALTCAALGLALLAAPARAHAIFPGSQTVRTLGERAFVRFQAVNGRRDVSEFAVEVFEGGSWVPSKIAVASPSRLVVPASDPGGTDTFERSFSVLVDLDGKPEQTLRVCTKSITAKSLSRPGFTRLNTRVCANVVVKRF